MGLGSRCGLRPRLDLPRRQLRLTTGLLLNYTALWWRRHRFYLAFSGQSERDLWLAHLFTVTIINHLPGSCQG